MGDNGEGSAGEVGDVAGYVAKLLRETREELARADQKASILLAAVGIAAGAAAAALVQVKFSPTSLPDSVEWLWWVGVALVAAGTITFGITIMPTLGNSGDGTVHYFGDISKFKGSNTELLEMIARDAAQQPRRDISQLSILARAVRRKYSLVKFAVSSVVVGFLAVIVVATYVSAR